MMREQDHRNISPATGLLDQRGFTLLELVVVMGIFITLMMITANSFNRIALQSSQQSKSLESQIEGIVGLEVLRADLEQAGFGLPWSFENSLTYSESSLGSSMPASNYWETGSPDSFNDAAVGGGNPPRAIQSGNTKFNLDSASKGAKYVVIKSLNLGTNETVKKWTNLSIDQSGARTLKIWGAASRDFTPDERLIVVRNSMTTTPPTRELVMSGTSFSTRFSNYSTFVKNVSNNSTLQIYGVAPATSPGSDQIRMPFNRADYYVMRPTSGMPASCAPNTGILYKSTISHVDGKYDKVLPLLDCVADFQIVYGLDTDGAGRINLHADTLPVTMTATEIRDQVREIRAYVLAQDGHRDPFYTYPSTTVDVGESFDGGSNLMGRRFTLSSDMLNYRWKVYTIVVRPKNLISN